MTHRYASPLIYSEACAHTGCCCRAEASGALVRPLVISLALCFHTAPGSVWIRSACDWSHLMFTLQWLIRAAVILSEGGRKLKTNSPIRQNHVLVIGGGLTAVLQGWQQEEVVLLINYLQNSYQILLCSIFDVFDIFTWCESFWTFGPCFPATWCTYIWNSNTLAGAAAVSLQLEMEMRKQSCAAKLMLSRHSSWNVPDIPSAIS